MPYYAPLFLDMRGVGSPVQVRPPRPIRPWPLRTIDRWAWGGVGGLIGQSSCDGAGAMTLVWDVAMLEVHAQGSGARRRMWAQLAHCHRAVHLACCQAMREWHGHFRYVGTNCVALLCCDAQAFSLDS